MVLIVAVGSLGPIPFREAYGRLLHLHIQIYGSWYTTLHALMHILSFGMLGGLAWLISERWLLRITGIAGILLLGLGIEWLQVRSYPGKPLETWDVRSDALGVCLGMIFAQAWFAARGRSSRSGESIPPIRSS
jgi:hypothetical protein